MIVRGEHPQCRQLLKTQNPYLIPRRWCEELAKLSVRVHEPLFALKLLRRHIYPENNLAEPSSDREKIAYTRALSHLGAYQEAIEILQKINFETAPEALYGLGCAHAFVWEYPASIPLFKKYIELASTPAYAKLVAQVNLAAAHIAVEAWEAAKNLLEEIKAECESHSYFLLLGNHFELRSQIHIFQGQFDLAEQSLERAAFYLKDQAGIYSLYVEKWKCILNGLRDPQPENLLALESLKAKAIALTSWSTVRECDLFSAVISKDQNLIEKVILGTPFPCYRQRARRIYGKKFVSRGDYQWKIGPGSPEVFFDPHQKGTGSEALFERANLFKLFLALSQDFYQPSSLGVLFQRIYPGEKMNPFTSPSRVLKHLGRLNIWFRENNWPLKVQIKKSEFRLISTKSIEIKIRRGRELTSQVATIENLKTHFQHQTMTSTKVAAKLAVSESTASRILNKAQAAGILQRSGQGKSTVYFFARRKKKLAA